MNMDTIAPRSRAQTALGEDRRRCATFKSTIMSAVVKQDQSRRTYRIKVDASPALVRHSQLNCLPFE